MEHVFGVSKAGRPYSSTGGLIDFPGEAGVAFAAGMKLKVRKVIAGCAAAFFAACAVLVALHLEDAADSGHDSSSCAVCSFHQAPSFIPAATAVHAALPIEPAALIPVVLKELIDLPARVRTFLARSPPAFR